MFQHFGFRVAAFAVTLALSPAVSTSYAYSPYADVVKACDNDNQRKAGTCKKAEKPAGVLHGCAGSVCFVCPADGRRQCYPANSSSVGGILHANMDVKLVATGVNIEAVVKACDYIHEHKQPCSYSTDTLPVLEGSAASGTRFQCVNKQECHAVR